MNVSSLITKDYRKNDDFAVRKNKPNSNPIPERPKMNASCLFTKDYENETTFRPKKNKPNPSGLRCLLRSCRTDQTQSKPIPCQIPSINGENRLVICSGKYSLDFPAFAGKQADKIIFPENRQYSFTAFFARNL